MAVGEIGVGIIGGGLMGRELASCLGRWFALNDMPIRPRLVAVCDSNPKTLDWFLGLGSVKHLCGDYREFLKIPEIEVVYVAVPHHLHEEIYCAVLGAGKDLMAEKPFGIDASAAQRIAETAARTGRFVRCSSEFPFFPGAKRAFEYAKAGAFGKLLEVRSAFHHSSDLDPAKPINWKRQVTSCGEIGVMGDLGMHACHLPLRLGWKPTQVHAQLQKVYSERPDGKGGMAACDTWDNAILNTRFNWQDQREIPLRIETKRLAPGATNTWIFEALGTDGGVRFSTAEPKSLWTFQRGAEQSWSRTDLGHASAFPTITGGIFEVGFPDILLQMWAAFFLERAGELGNRFGCATVEEALATHAIFRAALESEASRSVVPIELP